MVVIIVAVAIAIAIIAITTIIVDIPFTLLLIGLIILITESDTTDHPRLQLFLLHLIKTATTAVIQIELHTYQSLILQLILSQ